MAQLISVKLSRFDATPWGFRLQGGKDFGSPLVIQKVNGGSLAEKFGLQPGDALIRVNNVDLFDLKHKDAQDSIVRAGNNYELTIQRGGNTWRPSVTTVGPTPKVGAPAGAVQPVTKTSLAARKPDSTPIGGGHNLTARPFGPAQVNGEPTVKSIVNKQYNSPVGIYSEQTIAETLSAQAEVLAGGVLGVNFKKNEKNYNAENSEVFKMVHEIDNEPRDSAPEPAALPATIGLGNIPTPEIDVPPKQQDPFKILPPGQNICAECERLIIGVFVRIKDKNLHAECFKCATCGSSLKNVGYYKINEKLYCDIHAKQAARQNPPAPNLEPVTVPPGRSPASSISAALSGFSPSHTYSPVPTNVTSQGNLSPQTGTLAPLPFHPTNELMKPGQDVNISNSLENLNLVDSYSGINRPASIMTKAYKAPRLTTSHVSAPRSPVQTSTNFSGPKHFGALPSNTLPRPTTEALAKTLEETSKNLKAGGKLICDHCNQTFIGPFISALGKIWCPDHFVCTKQHCRRPLADIGFVEEQGDLYCEYCFEQFIAPSCNKCSQKIKGDCLNAIGKHFHPECFACTYCGTLFKNNPFFLEDGLPYCETDWNELFTTKCFACGFPIEAGDRWVEALSNNYHSQCFNCTNCKKNLEGQSFYAKGGRPFCKAHAR